MLALAGGLILVGYLPGALLMRVPVLERAKRAALGADERVFWSVILSGAWSLAVVLVLAAAGEYTYFRLLAVNGAASAVALLALRGRLRWRDAARPGPTVLAPLLLAALALWLYPPPSEYVIGGKDPGVYVNEGIQIAQRGSLKPVDPLIASVPVPTRDLFFPSHENRAYYGLRFMGFFITDPGSGEVVGQFPHAYPAAVAVGYGLHGLTGARYASLACALLGVLALYFLGARLTGWTAAAAGAALLAINVAQVWYARYPSSEVLAQALLLAGLLAFARAHVDEDPFFAPVAAVLLGLLLFVRFDAVLAVGLAGVAAVLLWLRGARLQMAFLIPLAGFGVLLGLYLLLLLTPYAQYPVIWWEFRRGRLLAALAAGLVALVVLAGLRRREWLRRALERWLPAALAVAIVALACYAFFVREPGGRLAVHDANSLRMFAWYVHPAALAAALLGLVLAAPRLFWRDPAFFLVAAGFSIFFFYRIQIVPEHFWMARRFVPIILPATTLFIAIGLLQSVARGRDGGGASIVQRSGFAARYALRAALLGLVAWSFFQGTRAIRPHVEYAGIIPRLEALAARFGSDDLIVVEARNASDLHVLALPLAYIYARPVLVLNSPRPDKTAFAAFLDWARARYRGVYFLGGGGTDLLSRRIGVEAVGSERFQVPEYDSPRNAYPTRVNRKEFDFGIYRFAPDARDGSTPIALDVGEMDDLHVVRFHAKERDDRGTFRWTRDQSYLALVGLGASSGPLVIWMANGGRPASAPPAEVEVYLADEPLGRVTVGEAMEPYSFPIPAALAARLGQSDDAAVVRLATRTWNPRALLGVDDGRDLGVRVDRVEVR